MATPPASDTFEATPQKHPITPGMAIGALLVPVMTVAGVVSSLQAQDIENDWSWRQQRACRHMPFPVTEYAAAWLGVALGVVAVVACVMVGKRIHRRDNVPLWRRWPGLVAFVCVWPNLLAIPMELIMLYEAYSAAGSGVLLGDCG
ncbi:hypothetical protein [Streptomyces sp. NPDC037389]|uniref:hypothetical protein n=1 Tax=Streptomyces sp. NPDC037389 TaxID=3155369 RepID=UPI00340C1DA7